MKKWLKVLSIILGVIVVVVLGGVTYLFTAFPKHSEVRDLKIEITKERVERGKYLAEKVFLCQSCHSPRDFTKFAGPIPEGKDYVGGEEFVGPFGVLHSANLTPYHLSKYSDGQLFLAITEGIKVDGSPMFPVMPYDLFAKQSEEEIYSVIAYLRTLQPVENEVHPSELKFPFNIIARLAHEPYVPSQMPEIKNSVDHGKYIAQACVYCHTPMDDQGQKLPGMELAGGMEFELPGNMIVHSANISPDPETGIGNWTKENFIARFKSFDKPEIRQAYVDKGIPNTVMPWYEFSKMDSTDLSDIYDYLKTMKPVNHKIEKFAEVAAK